MDQERPFWRTVVYLNVIKAIRMILDDLDYEFAALSEHSSQTRQGMAPPLSTLVVDFESLRNIWEAEFGPFRTKLLPLIVLEETLATELSDVVGGRAGVYTRHSSSRHKSTISSSDTRRKSDAPETVNLVVARMLGMSVESIKALWGHRIVKSLMHWRRLRLNESTPL